MPQVLRKAWTDLVQPLLQRPKRFQVAALCYRGKGNDREILLITSRDTGRWILPKGWPIDGMSAAQSARQEAWEEAGVVSAGAPANAVGSYEYQKGMDIGASVPCETKVFMMEVEGLAEDFPEAAERTRKWVTPSEAAEMVDEPDLAELLRSL